MNAREEIRPHGYIQKHREKLRNSARITYGFSRFAVFLYGGAIVMLYIYSPIAGEIMVPDFSLEIFAAMLAMLLLSEIVFRMTEYSCENYIILKKTDDEDSAEQKDSILVRLAFWPPLRGVHTYLLVLWFLLAFYYLFLGGVVYGGEKENIFPGNFPLSFFIVAGACVLDFISKGIFIFRIPGLAGFVAEFTNAAIRSDGRDISAKILDGFLKILQKMPFTKKGR